VAGAVTIGLPQSELRGIEELEESFWQDFCSRRRRLALERVGAIIIFSSSGSDQRSAQRCHTGRLADKRILHIYFSLLKRLSKRSALYMPLEELYVSIT
jgi:hypothetical protein